MAREALSCRRLAAWCAAALGAAWLAGCGAAPALPAAPVAVAVPTPVPPPAPAPEPPLRAEAAAPAEAPSPLGTVLAHADRVRALSAPDLSAEIARLGDGGALPARQMQLALALLQTQQPADGQRAQALLQRVLATDTPEARALHPLARQVAAQYAAQRRAEEQAERQAQQLRDAQRRSDQLAERLEALRALERSMPSRVVR